MDLTKCKKTIKKIAENHVIVEYSLVDVNGKDYVVQTEEYGQERITKEKEVAQAEVDKWSAFDVKKINESKAMAQVKLTDVDSLQAEMDKKLGDRKEG